MVNQSFHFNSEKGLYHCKSCGVSGNIWQFVEHFGIDLAEYGLSKTAPPIDKNKIAIYHGSLLGRSDLLLSCWQKDIIQRLQVGWNTQLNQYVFPIFNTKGNIVFVKQHKGYQTKRAKATLYPLNLIAEYDDSYIVIDEGEKDVVTLLSNGIQAITSTGGALTVPANISILRRFKRIYLCFDNDSVGKKGIEKWIIRLHQLDPTLNVRVCDLSKYVQDKGDVTDYFLIEGKSRQKFLNEILEKSYYVRRPFTDIPVYSNEILTGERFLGLSIRDRIVLMTLVLRASRYYCNTNEIRGMRFELRPGQYIRSRKLLAKDCGKEITESMVRRSMVKLKNEDYISTKDLKGKRGMRITLTQWNEEYGQSKRQSNNGKTIKENFPNFSSKDDSNQPDNGQSNN